ncbi:MAG: hypothetical protein JSW39_12395 [Desulfobacterales bacterium]|nr:MAG: hypothetical protein JSW39_12395 [Desulfobacterales bacterium]
MEKSEVARQILAYLADHPDARDTLEGIVHWWLLESQIKYQIFLVREAIQELVDRELLLEEVLPGSEPGYRINATKQDEIRKFFQGAGGPSRGRRPRSRKRKP